MRHKLYRLKEKLFKFQHRTSVIEILACNPGIINICLLFLCIIYFYSYSRPLYHRLFIFKGNHLSLRLNDHYASGSTVMPVYFCVILIHIYLVIYSIRLGFYARSQNLQKATASSCLSVSLEKLSFRWKDFDETLYLRLFRKFIEKIQVLWKSDKNDGYFTWRRFHVFGNVQLLLGMRNVLETIGEKVKTHMLCSTPFSRKSCRFWDNVEKYDGAKGATNVLLQSSSARIVASAA